MLAVLRRALVSRLSLTDAVSQWDYLRQVLAEPPRRRRLQRAIVREL